MSNPFESWTIGQLLRYLGPETRLRKRFREDPFLNKVTLGELIYSPFALADFMTACKKLPHCGDASLGRLRDIIENVIKTGLATDNSLRNSQH
ncbi:MAG: hypothetical protein LAT78_09885 [Roseinatronobacter sp.]|nr:hypothetical protein [Roseinatronobacter sp.]